MPARWTGYEARFLLNPDAGRLQRGLAAVGVRVAGGSPPWAAAGRRGDFRRFGGGYYWRLYHFPAAAENLGQAVPVHVVVGARGVVAWSAHPLAVPAGATFGARWAFAVAEAALHSTLAVLDRLDRRLTVLEPAALLGAPDDLKLALLRLKRELAGLRQLATSERDAVYRAWAVLGRSRAAGGAALGAYHAGVRLCEAVDLYRDVINTVLDTHLAAESNRLNQIVKTLTVVTTILLPASLLASLWGTNFTYLPGAHARWGFFALLGLVAAVCGSLLWTFRRRGWF